MDKICVNARFLSQKISGVQRFAIEISKRLKAKHPHIEFLSPDGILDLDLKETLGVKVIGKNKGHLWEQWDLPRYLKKKQNPLLLNLCNTAPLYYRPKMVCIHDLAFLVNPKWFSKKFYWFYSFLIPRIARSAEHLLTVSEFSKNEINQFLKIPRDKISVLYNAIDDRFSPPEENQQNENQKNYILAVSSLDPRKNFLRLIEAFQKAAIKDVELKIVGAKNAAFADNPLFDQLNDQRITFTGYVDDAALIRLYQEATLFVYPSLYEGFGLPPLEAMACACPTLVSNQASLPEICGEASEYINPYEIPDIIGKIEKLMQDQKRRKELVLLGQSRVEQFSWEKSVHKLIRLIESIPPHS